MGHSQGFVLKNAWDMSPYISAPLVLFQSNNFLWLRKKEIPKMAFWIKESKDFIQAKSTVSKSCHLGILWFKAFLHFKGCSYLNHKISFNLSVCVTIFFVFHNPYMMLFHILKCVLDHDWKLDNFLIPSSVSWTLQKRQKKVL